MNTVLNILFGIDCMILKHSLQEPDRFKSTIPNKTGKMSGRKHG